VLQTTTAVAEHAPVHATRIIHMRWGKGHARAGELLMPMRLWELACRGSTVEETGKGQTSMMTQTELEARLLAVETALKAIQHRLATLSPTEHWLDAIIGSFKDEPAFDEVIALGRAFREAEPYPEDPGAPA